MSASTRTAILSAAAEVLGTDPAAGMGDIAAAAGVGRATVYRHYATRDALEHALRERVRAEFGELVGALEADGDLEAFVAGVLALREAALPLPAPTEARVRRAWAPVANALELDLPADWAVVSLRALIRAAGAEVDAGRLSHEHAAALVVRTLRR